MPTGRDVVGLLAAVVVLAGFAVAVKNGGGVAIMLQSAGEAFSNVLRAATAGGA